MAEAAIQTSNKNNNNTGDTGGLDGKSGDWMNDDQLIHTFDDNHDGAWSLVLEFDSVQSGTQCLWMDAGYMARHSRFIEGFVQNLNLNLSGDNRSAEILSSSSSSSPSVTTVTTTTTYNKLSHHPIVVPMPRVFMQRCSVEDVRHALACLYFPDRFPVRFSNIRQTAQVADFFDIPTLQTKCDEALNDYIKRKINNNGASIRFMWFGEKEWNNLLEAMLLADRYQFTNSWQRLKLSVLRSLEDLCQLMDHHDFNKLSAAARLDLLEGCVRKHMLYLRHNWC